MRVAGIGVAAAIALLASTAYAASPGPLATFYKFDNDLNNGRCAAAWHLFAHPPLRPTFIEQCRRAPLHTLVFVHGTILSETATTALIRDVTVQKGDYINMHDKTGCTYFVRNLRMLKVAGAWRDDGSTTLTPLIWKSDPTCTRPPSGVAP